MLEKVDILMVDDQLAIKAFSDLTDTSCPNRCIREIGGARSKVKVSFDLVFQLVAVAVAHISVRPQ